MTCHGCHEQICTCPDPVYSGLAEPLFVIEVMPVSPCGTCDVSFAGGSIPLKTAPGNFRDPLHLSRTSASAMPICGAPPLTGETSPRLAGDLVDQGACDFDEHVARSEVKGAAVHAPAYRSTGVATS